MLRRGPGFDGIGISHVHFGSSYPLREESHAATQRMTFLPFVLGIESGSLLCPDATHYYKKKYHRN